MGTTSVKPLAAAPLPATPHAGGDTWARAWLEVDLAALRRNVMRLRERLTPGTAVLAVVKANAYGVGAVAVARALLQAEPAPLVDMLGVAEVREAIELREAGISAPILLLGASLPHEIELALHHNVIPTLASPYELRLVNRLVRDLLGPGATHPVHLGIDTGMNRHGCRAGEDVAELLEVLDTECPYITLAGMYTHLSSPAEPNRGFTHRQLQHLFDAYAAARARNLEPATLHAAASAGLMNYPAAQCTMVRTGLAMFGVDPGYAQPHELSLESVVALRARVLAVRTIRAGEPVSYGRSEYLAHDTRLATLAIGYDDGVRRELSGHGHVLLHGKRCPIVGKVTMDATMIDIGHLPNVHPGNTATLIGPTSDSNGPASGNGPACDGNESGDHNTNEITLHEIAAHANTIPYDILCGIGRRIPRHYTENETAPPPYSNEIAPPPY